MKSLPKSISYLRYFNKGKHIEFYYAFLGAIAGFEIALSIVFQEPLLFVGALGIVGVMFAAKYKDTEQETQSHYLAASVWAIPKVLLLGWWATLPIGVLVALTFIRRKMEVYLLGFELALALTSYIIII